MPTSREPDSPSARIDARIEELGDWRGEVLARVRRWIHEADPEVEETWKWRGVPVWEHDGILCTGETYRDHVKLTFAKGASLADPKGLFNASLDGNVRRAIDIREGDRLDQRAFKALVKAAVALNEASRRTPRKAAAAKKGTAKEAKKTTAPKKRTAKKTTAPKKRTAKKRTAAEKAAPAKKAATPRLLSGGNPQIAKGSGEEPVQAYIDALPDAWKRDVARRIDAIVERAVPGVRKAVKWNSPFYGVPGQGWILSLHAFSKYLKLTFFNGVALDPVPPGGTDPEARWIDIREGGLDEAQITRWAKQAGERAGWMTGDIAESPTGGSPSRGGVATRRPSM